MRRVKKSKPVDTKYLRKIGETWYLRIKVNGVILQQTLRTTSLERAQQLRDERVVDFTARMDEKKRLTYLQRQLAGIAQEEEEEQKSPMKGCLLIEAFKLFESDPSRRQCKPVQLEQHKTNWQQFLGWMFKRHPDIQYCRQATRPICMEWASELLMSVKATNTYNHKISSVHYVFTSIEAFDEFFQNPMRGIKKRKDSDCCSKQPFTSDELRTIFQSPNEEFKRLAAIGFYTTLRLSSARKLTWEKIDDNLEYINGILHDKTGADATQRICNELKYWLSRVPAEERHGLVCPEFGRRSKSNAVTLVQGHLAKLGIQTQTQIPGLNGLTRTVCIKGFHSFRHTAITLALRHGATVSQVKRLAGHASEAMQARYTHLGADDAGAASAAIGKFWDD